MFWGQYPPEARLLIHRSPALVGVFLTLLTAMMIGFLRGPLARFVWPIPAGVLLGWICTPIALFAYYYVFESDVLHRALDRTPFVAVLGAWGLFAPVKSLSWLVGGLAGVFFALCRFILSQLSLRALGVSRS
jgi:hypothetical protein